MPLNLKKVRPARGKGNQMGQPQNSVTIRDSATREIIATIQVGSRANLDYGTAIATTASKMLRSDWGRLSDWAERYPDRDRELIIADEYPY
jgi:hypothetical protein